MINVMFLGLNISVALFIFLFKFLILYSFGNIFFYCNEYQI